MKLKEREMDKIEVWHMFGGPGRDEVTADTSRAERGEELFKGTAEEAEELAAVPADRRWRAAQEIAAR